MEQKEMEVKIANLPAWLRNYIKKLEQQRESAVSQLNEFLDTQTESAIYIDELSCHVSPPKTVKKFIQSRIVNFGSISIRFLSKEEGGGLNINGGRGSLTIHPQASNSFVVREEKR